MNARLFYAITLMRQSLYACGCDNRADAEVYAGMMLKQGAKAHTAQLMICRPA